MKIIEPILAGLFLLSGAAMAQETEIAEEIWLPRTLAEQLEYTGKEALIKVDFYERVVRSIAREEKELAEFNRIINIPENKETDKKENKK